MRSRNGRTRKTGELAELLDAELGQLIAPFGTEREKVQRERLQEELGLGIVDDQRTTHRRDARSRERGEAAPGNADTRLPKGPHGVEGTAKRGVQASRQPLDARGLEVRASGLDGLDGETGVLEPPEDSFPLLFGGGGILFGENEVGTCGKCLGETHPGAHARLLGGSRARPQKRTAAGRRSERNGPAHELWSGAEGGAEGKRLDVQAGDHGNVCSTRTHVLLSTPL